MNLNATKNAQPNFANGIFIHKIFTKKIHSLIKDANSTKMKELAKEKENEDFYGGSANLFESTQIGIIIRNKFINNIDDGWNRLTLKQFIVLLCLKLTQKI